MVDDALNDGIKETEQLVELHLYLVPKEKWLEKRKLAKNQAVDHTISVGFVRVLPQIFLSDLREEMNRQLGIESVPQNFVFLRSVGRNFTQVRPKQEMEMKVKNYIPPFAPEPELFLKEGSYTGPSTWSQGEDSGLEESLADSNSQRSHDRATPESLTDDHLILPKLTDYLDVPVDIDGGRMPPGAMTVSMSADDLSSTGLYHRASPGVRGRESPLIRSVRPDYRYSSDDVRYRKDRSLRQSSDEHRLRGDSWIRRQKRSCSKERGGAQLPTWAETRTTRLRRSKALGETQRPAAKKASGRQEAKISPPDEDAGHILMERIRVNSRCLKAQLSSHHSRRMVADVGTASRERKAVKNGKGGVYTEHARRNRKGSSEDDHQASDAEIESTTVKLVDELGREVSSEIASNLSGDPQDSPEIVHHHILAVNGEDANKVGIGRKSEIENINGKLLDNISERGQTSSDSSCLDTKESNEADHTRTSSKGTTGREELPANDLEEGRLVNQNGDLVIEVEVKEMASSEGSNDPTTATFEMTPVPMDDPNEYDSYRVYSEQNYPTPPTDTPTDSPLVRRSSRQDISVRNENSRLERARHARGVYLRRMEHRNSQSNIHRSQSTDQGLEGAGESPARKSGRNPRSISQNRKSGQRKLEKWSTSAASTGDLREASWDYSNDKDRLLAVLSEARGESSLRQRRREELLRRIKQLQSRAHLRREQVREMWRKRYLEAKKITPRLEEECSRLRQELEKLHRELLAKVQAGVWALLTISGKTERPSNKLSYKIMIARLLQEIEDLTRRVEGTRLKLHTEVKLRAMAEKDVRNLREELLKKKIQVTLTRNQEQAAMGNSLRQQYFISAV